MTQITTIPAPPRPRRRRWRTALALFVVLIAGLAAGCWYLVWAEERDFQAALAETDELDPGWRFADLEAGRVKIPDENNAALQVLKARRLGASGSIGMALEEQIGALPVNVQLNAEQTAALRKFFAADPKALRRAHRLKDLIRGRYPVTYDPKTANLDTTWAQQSREMAHYLHLSALLAAHDGDAKQVADVCRACINNARSMGDEPTMIGLLVRVAVMELSLQPLEARAGPGRIAAGRAAPLAGVAPARDRRAAPALGDARRTGDVHGHDRGDARRPIAALDARDRHAGLVRLGAAMAADAAVERSGSLPAAG